ncbi:23S rRNA (adenine(2030)-N(6))-methyltransferase RlmJ [Derxia lacustris]|uniref:23S rRNA (adenine(2030)-N(6))-methyltransferase RlmJ n=1 Tax=Derxia lacustris TaxID=764842 RepID=UPI000A17875E|nr:23S rRNA (adenine(2030)-N(6))-methyltransferase RlmJ [Derxia lacustris]
MLAYRHAFHAGNHADVLKHLVLVQVMQYLAQKDTPYWLVDTHAGAGAYSLASGEAQKHGEYKDGIGRLWTRDDLPEPVADYLAVVRQFNGPGALANYPGSPAIAHMLLREQDRLRLYELHPTDNRLLTTMFKGEKHTEVKKADGFESLKSQLPPPSKRACVLIDPPYELRKDYDAVVTTLKDAMVRFPIGTYLVWYPKLKRRDTVMLPDRLKRLAPKGWLHAELTVSPPGEDGYGLLGSGMFVINPPWTLHAQLQATLPWLKATLGQYAGASWKLEQHAV